MGEVVVLVPRGVCVATSARIGGGYVGALESGSGGLDVHWVERPFPPSGTPRLAVDVDVGLGSLLVADRPIAHGGHGWGGWGAGGSWFAAHAHPAALGANEACFPAGGARR